MIEPDPSAPIQSPAGSRRHFALRIVAGGLLAVGVAFAARRHGDTPEQEELRRYVELTVPGYLTGIADVRTRFEHLGSEAAPDGGGATFAARAALVDDITPRLVTLRRRATSVLARSPSVVRSNTQLIAAVDLWIEAARLALRAIDDADAVPEERHRQVVTARRDADAAVRAWMMELRATCGAAGFRVTL